MFRFVKFLFHLLFVGKNALRSLLFLLVPGKGLSLNPEVGSARSAAMSRWPGAFLPMSSFSRGSVYRGESEVSGSPPWRAGEVGWFCFKLGELIACREQREGRIDDLEKDAQVS